MAIPTKRLLVLLGVHAALGMLLSTVKHRGPDFNEAFFVANEVVFFAQIYSESTLLAGWTAMACCAIWRRLVRQASLGSYVWST
jgi:hypothetical protein